MNKITAYEKFVLSLLVFVPVAVVLELADAPAIWVFVVSAIAIVPLAGLLGRSTEHLAVRAGAGLGAFLNASLGNAAELIIAFSALRAGLQEVVKASLTGAIIGNVLLITGLAFFLGGLRRDRQTFNRTAASMNSTLLILSAIGLLVPALFHFVSRQSPNPPEFSLSLEISVVLVIAYALSLIFSFWTHRDLYIGKVVSEEQASESWSTGAAVAVLITSGVLVAVMSELLVGSIEPTARALGMSDVFIGVVFVAIIGNAAEHFAAVTAAVKNNMDVALGIALGSSQQIALFVAPLLVFSSYFLGKPMDLVFTPFEVAAVTLAVLITESVSTDGESNWMEGVLLLSVYFILALAFYFLP